MVDFVKLKGRKKLEAGSGKLEILFNAASKKQRPASLVYPLWRISVISHFSYNGVSPKGINQWNRAFAL